MQTVQPVLSVEFRLVWRWILAFPGAGGSCSSQDRSDNVFPCPSFPGFISNMTIQRQFFPNDEDQTGAAKALLRLQDTYNLDTDTLSRGNLPGESLPYLFAFPKCPDYKSFGLFHLVWLLSLKVTLGMGLSWLKLMKKVFFWLKSAPSSYGKIIQC